MDTIVTHNETPQSPQEIADEAFASMVAAGGLPTEIRDGLLKMGADRARVDGAFLFWYSQRYREAINAARASGYTDATMAAYEEAKIACLDAELLVKAAW